MSLPKLIRQVGFYLILFIIFPVLLILGLEILTRTLFPHINHQDTETSLFASSGRQISFGWKPGAKGVCFGQEVEIDLLGHRRMAGPEQWETSWLILGDSVAFGVGVRPEETFVGLLQSAFPTIKMWNTAVVGYAIENYQEVMLDFVLNTCKVEKVLMFYCLNDVDEPIKSIVAPTGIDKILSFLRRNSKFYMLLKGILADRSKTYFLYDLQNYIHHNPRFNKTLHILDEIHGFLENRGIEFVIIILPYEYQLREEKEAHLKPQHLLSKHLRERNISYYDATECIANKDYDSRQLFLHGDAMHYSKDGHRIVYNCVKEFIWK